VPRLAALTLAALLPSAALADDGRLHALLDLETGAQWATRNDAAVPGSSGTRFSMAGGDFEAKTVPYARIQAGLRLGRHRLLGTFAPVRLSGHGASGGTLLFRGQTFTTDGSASFHYKFDTYRLTYRYALVDRPTLDLQVGVTALVRDAEIRLSQGAQSTAERNVGFVPLLSLRAAWAFAGPLRLALDGDALAAKQGRAEDVSLALEFQSGDLTFRAGYRVLEGGADNDRVYSFAWLNHAMVGVRYEP
jgi:hypothetical protein